jgi:hypothetical protein
MITNNVGCTSEIKYRISMAKLLSFRRRIVPPVNGT